MRTKHLILILIGVIIATLVFIVFGPAGEPNDSFKHIVVQTHQQLKEFQVSNVVRKPLCIMCKGGTQSCQLNVVK